VRSEVIVIPDLVQLRSGFELPRHQFPGKIDRYCNEDQDDQTLCRYKPKAFDRVGKIWDRQDCYCRPLRSRGCRYGLFG
jgi:hypothetical protein